MGYFASLAAGDRPVGTAVLTFLEGLASEMEGIDEGALTADATRWANALPRAARLVGSAAVAVGGGRFQSVLRAALTEGSAMAVDVLVETVARLAETQRGERDVIVVVPGPGRLLDTGADAGTLKTTLVAVMERLCASRPAMILLDERNGAVIDGTPCRRLAATLKNVADYYGVALGVQLSEVADPLVAVAARRGLRLDHLLIAAESSSPAECRAAATDAGWRSLGLAGPPCDLPAGGPDDAALWFAMTCSQGDIETLKGALADR